MGDTCQPRPGSRKGSFLARALDRRGGGIYVKSALPHPDEIVRIFPPGLFPLGLAVSLLLALPGCHLLDQTDFDPKPPAVAPLPPVPDPETRPALVTIDYVKANPDYASALAAAVHAVETRRPGALYDVVGVVGDAGAAPLAQTRAAEVMTEIEGQGVIPARVQLGVKIEPGRKVTQVRVYLR
jgi:hypothetical protein